MTSEQLETFFEPRGVRRGGTLMFTPPVALELVAAARAAGISILGIDGFWLRADATVPTMAHSIDCSAGPSIAAKSWDMAESFIRERIEPDMYLEIVLE